MQAQQNLSQKVKTVIPQIHQRKGNKSTELKKVTIANIGTDGTLTEVARIAQSKGFFRGRACQGWI